MYATVYVEAVQSLPLKVHWHSDACACAMYDKSVALSGALDAGMHARSIELQQQQQQRQWAVFDHENSHAQLLFRPPLLQIPEQFGLDSAADGSTGGALEDDVSAEPSPLFPHEIVGEGGVLPTPRNLAGDADAQVHMPGGWIVLSTFGFWRSLFCSF